MSITNILKLAEALDLAIKGIDVEKNQEFILSSKSPIYIYYFGKLVKHANLEKIEDALIDLQAFERLFSFAYNLEKSNKEKIFKAILQSNDDYYINRFLKEIDFNKDQFKDYLPFI